jgi:hypothetical protein
MLLFSLPSGQTTAVTCCWLYHEETQQLLLVAARPIVDAPGTHQPVEPPG